MRLISVLLSTIVLWTSLGLTKTERVYNLRLHYMNLNRAGVNKPKSIGINGTSPGPTLRFQKGDIALINVTNDLNEDTSIHWHGLLVPWNMDGPSFTNNFVLKPGQTQKFQFEIKQTGTYWYHSHTMFQEQVGMHGSIVIEDDHHRFHGDHDFVMVLGDWTNEDPMQVLKNLKTDGDYYNLKKKFFPSIWDAVQRAEFWDYLKSEWTKMGPMDLSDVGYDAFLINGKRVESHPEVKPGDLVRMRFINAGASSYFYVNIGNMRSFMVITKDGLEVEPVEVNELLIGMGETYDVLFEVPDEGHAMGFEVRATSMDTTGWASSILGEGKQIERPPTKVRPSPYKMAHSGHGGNENGGTSPPSGGGGHGGHGDGNNSGGHNGHQMIMLPMSGGEDHGDHGDIKDPVGKANRLDYSMLKAVEPTVFDPKWTRHDIQLNLTGNMNRYVWSINNKIFSDETYLTIKKDEVVRVTINNKSMMRHPMHLHGHFFRILNGQGDYSPNFHTIDVGPGQQVTIEFWANEPGFWFFHCHNLYHMEMGMARVFRYEGFELPKDLKDSEKLHQHGAGSMVTDKTFIPSGEAKLYSNHAELNARLNGGNWDISMQVEVDKYKVDTLDSQVLFKRYLTPFLAIVGGAEYEDKNLAAVLGIAYRLPMIIDMTTYVRSDGKVVLQLRKQIPIVGRVALELNPKVSYGGKTGVEYQIENELTYRLTNKVKLGFFQKYSDDLGNTVGAGISVIFN